MTTLAAIAGLPLWEIAAASCVLSIAGIVRGFSGFGFSMVAVTALSLLRPPAEIIPMVMLLEVAASANLLTSGWRDADWGSLAWLLAGMVVATPLGVLVLARVAPTPMRIVVSLLVLAAAIGLLSGWRMRRTPGALATLATGALAGFLNGAASIAGPPVIVFYLSSPAAMHVSRASLIAFFVGCDIVALGAGGACGLVTMQTWYRAACFLLPVAAGVVIGNHGFRRIRPDAFRRLVLLILMVLSLGGLLRAALGP